MTKRKRRPGTSQTELPAPVEVSLSGIEHGLEANAKAYRFGECYVLVAHSPAGWHLSISTATRYPTWDEVAHARYTLIPPEPTMAMLLPHPDEYLNVHDFTFHLWQIEHDKFRPVYDSQGKLVGHELRDIG